MPVILESAGGHNFDLPHIRRSGGPELIQELLDKAGYSKNLKWRVRINEKQKCSGNTPPLSIINFKKWGIYLRIKPGDNNTCHNVTLLIPQGIDAYCLFYRLKISNQKVYI